MVGRKSKCLYENYLDKNKECRWRKLTSVNLMMLVRLQNKSENDLYKGFLVFCLFFNLKFTDKCRRKRLLRNYNGPKVA